MCNNNRSCSKAAHRKIWRDKDALTAKSVSERLLCLLLAKNRADPCSLASKIDPIQSGPTPTTAKMMKNKNKNKKKKRKMERKRKKQRHSTRRRVKARSLTIRKAQLCPPLRESKKRWVKYFNKTLFLRTCQWNKCDKALRVDFRSSRLCFNSSEFKFFKWLFKTGKFWSSSYSDTHAKLQNQFLPFWNLTQ